MKLVYFGDVLGKSGRQGLEQHLPLLIDKLTPDFIIVNGENAAMALASPKKSVSSFLSSVLM